MAASKPQCSKRAGARNRITYRAIWLLWLTVLFFGACHPPGDRNILKIGLSEEPRTLNIWLAGDANSRKVLSQIYAPLFVRDPESLAFVPWLAEELPAYDPQKKIYTVRLRKALKWSDGEPLTAEDVVFTGRLIQSFQIPRYASKWSNIKQIEALDDHTVVFHIKKPYATFLSGTMTAPVAPAHQWRAIAEDAKKSQTQLAALLNHEISRTIGSGPFVFKQWQRGNYLYMEKNPYFFAGQKTINGRTPGPHVNGLLFKIYGTTDVAVLALRKGEIDFLWWGIQPGYLEQLNKTPHVRVFQSTKSALYYLGFNTRRRPFSDPVLRQAMAVLIDKQFIVERILQGYGTRMDAVVPPGNVQWYNADVVRYGFGLDREERIRKAYALLSRAGYTWKIEPVDGQGGIRPGEGLRLPDGKSMAAFNLLTPPADYDPHRAMSGMMIQEWMRDLGIPVFSRPMHFSSLLQKIKTNHDFDAFILGYGRLSLDPDYMRFFFISGNDKPRGWNICGYRNPEYDRLAVQSESEMNPDLRRQIIFDLQRIISKDVACLPLYSPDLLEAVRTDRFQGWVPMIDGIGNPWSFCRLKPAASSSRSPAEKVARR